MTRRKQIKWAIIGLVAVALTGWITSSWGRWFGNEPELPYTVPTVPDRITLCYGPDAQHDRCLTWRCDTIQHAYAVELRTPTDSMMLPASSVRVESRAGFQYFYRCELYGLMENATYRYRLCSETDTTAWHAFVMAERTDSIRFMVLGDIQDSVGGDSPDLLRMASERLGTMDFYAFVGDMIERPTDRYWQMFYSSIDPFCDSIPLMVCTGNHDYLKGIYKTIDPRWRHTFGTPLNGPDRFMGRSYYVDFTDMRFIVIDTDALQLPWEYADARSWVSNVLHQSTKHWNVVLMHHPLHSASIGRDNPTMRWAFRSLFEGEHGPDLVLAGHDHSYMRWAAETAPLYMVLTTATKDYLSKSDPGAAKVACGHRLYQQVVVTPQAIALSSYLAETGELYDSVRIEKQTGTPAVIRDLGQHIAERIDLPHRFSGKDGSRVKKFRKLRSRRASEPGRNVVFED